MLVLTNSSRSTSPYNKYMGGVDLGDRKIYHVSTEHPSKRYWKKLYYTFLTSTNMVKSDCFLWTGIRLTAIHSGVCILSNYN